jgi:hypothetical protein
MEKPIDCLSPHPSYRGPSEREIRKHAVEVTLNGKVYLIFKVEGGQVIDLPQQNVEKIKKVAQLAIRTHQTAAEKDSNLQGKELTHIDSAGSYYAGTSPLFLDHSQTKIENYEDYLNTTDDFAWQEQILKLSKQASGLQPDDLVPKATLIRMFPHDFCSSLKITSIKESYSPQEVKQFLLNYTKQKIWKTHAVHIRTRAKINDREKPLNELREWSEGFSDIETAINNSNQEIKKRFDAKEVWQTLVDLTDTPSRASPPSGNNPPLNSSFSSTNPSIRGNSSFSPSSPLFITTAPQPQTFPILSPSSEPQSTDPLYAKLEKKAMQATSQSGRDQKERSKHAQSAREKLKANNIDALSNEELFVVKEIIEKHEPINDFKILDNKGKYVAVLHALNVIV